MSTAAVQAPDLLLATVAGPREVALELDPPGPLTIGRMQGQDVALVDGETVSRRHAEFRYRPAFDEDPGEWVLVDVGSTHGTWLNGSRLVKKRECPVREGDLIVIQPWTMRLVNRSRHATGRTLITLPDDAAAMSGASIARLETSNEQSLEQERLAVLMECATAIHAADSEAALAEAVLEAAVRGTGFANAAMLSPVDDGGRVEVHGACGSILGAGAALRLSRTLIGEASSGVPARFERGGGGGSTPAVMGAASIEQLGITEAICIPIMLQSTVVGHLYLDNRENEGGQKATPDAADFGVGLSRFAALAFSNLKRFDMERRYARERASLFMGTLAALVSSIDAKDPYTRGHSERVSWLSEMLARATGLDDDVVEQVRVCGLVHDVGKIGVPEAVLCKEGRLTDEEFDAIKAHPTIGHGILQDIPQLQPMLGGVRHHHEKWDGGGYPDGITGEDIPLFGRIVGLADAYDAMRSKRTYRDAMPHEQVMDEVRKCAGSHFDPELAERFSKMDLAEFDRMIERHLSEG